MPVLMKFLNDEQQRQLLEAPRCNTSPLAQRDYHVMRLLVETGMRINEFCLLQLAQATAALASGWIVTTKDQRKGRKKGHEYLVTQAVRQSLTALIDLHPALRPAAGVDETKPAPLVWGRCTGKAQHISVRALQVRVKIWARLAGLPGGLSPHWLRHTRGVNIIRRSRGNNPLKVAQLALGHDSIGSTGIYTQMSREEYVRELQAVSGGRMRKADARAEGAAL